MHIFTGSTIRTFLHGKIGPLKIDRWRLSPGDVGFLLFFRVKLQVIMANPDLYSSTSWDEIRPRCGTQAFPVNVPMVQAPPGLPLEADDKNPLLGEQRFGSLNPRFTPKKCYC